MIQVQTAWSLLVAFSAVGISAATGLSTGRADVLLALVPAIALTGLSGIRQVFYATYTTRSLGIVDVVCNVAQAVVVAAIALLTRSAIAVSVVISAVIVIDTTLVFRLGARLLDGGRATWSERWRLLRTALPFGAGSLLASAYFTLDMTIIAYLVPSRQVGYYAAATKSLSVLVTIPGLVITAALSGLSKKAADKESLGQLVARLWHWLGAIALPLCTGVIVFAATFVRLFFGSDYSPAISLTRILAGSAIVALLTNVFGAALVAAGRNGWLVIQGALGVLLNVGGNLLLVPRYGVVASAWLTLGTEVFVCSGAVLGIWGRVHFHPLVRTSMAPIVASAALAASGMLLAGKPLIGVPSAGASFLLVLLLLDGWPEEFPQILPRPLGRRTR